MLFTVTEEMHTWAVKPKQHCTRGGEGEGEFVPFGHEGCMARRTALKCPSSFVRGRRLFFVVVLKRAVFNGSTTRSFKIFLNFTYEEEFTVSLISF